jgi:prepilin-type N-terminal cleavage/methylation domain-containing protein
MLLQRTPLNIFEGFTLIEVLLVVAILTVIISVSAPLYGSLQNTTELDVDTNNIVQDLYQAQAYSRSELNDCSWGVAINSQTLTLFCGSTYLTRNTIYDVNYIIPSAISLSGLKEIDYSKLYGLPQATGLIQASIKGKSRSMTINSKGMIEY